MNTYIQLYGKEDEHVTCSRDLVPTTFAGLESMIISQKDLATLREKEHNFCDKKSSKYFRLKIEDSSLYKQIKEAIKPYLTDNMLKILAHRCSTQLNEAMNNSVMSNAPNTKNFCRTISLKTRVRISGAVMALVY